jgi:hypothetical protein
VGLLDNLTPQQRKILKYGTPVVIGAAVVSKFTNRDPAADGENPEGVEGTATGGARPSSTVTGGGYLPPVAAPFTGAVGVDQLASFESGITGALLGLTERLSSMETTGATPPPTAEETATAQYTAQMVYDLFARYGKNPASATETADQRVARIVRDLNAGVRTWAQVETSIMNAPS